MSDQKAASGGYTGEYPAADTQNILVGPATEDQFNTARLPLIPIACFFIDDLRFAFDSSFVDADCSGGADPPEDIRLEFAALADLVKQHPGCPLSVFGHADPVGTDVYNKGLSERRARAIYALLIFQTEPDTSVAFWRSIASAENWGAGQRGKMQTLTGLAAGDDATLMRAYMQRLSKPAPKLAKTDFLAQGADPDRKGDFQGCSEFNPLVIFSQEAQDRFDAAKANNNAQGIADRNRQNAPNRRVLGLMFRKGSIVVPAKWPCPRASEGISGCVARFWSDGEARRGNHLPNNVDRRFPDKKDTFACRFYQRLAGLSPCEGVVCTCTTGVAGRHFYTTADKRVANLIGARAKIKTRFGKLCCEGRAKSAAFSSPFVNISNETGNLIWAQTGFNKERTAGHLETFTCRFAEANGATYHVNFDTANPPAEGSEHLYQVDLNEATGAWTFSFDGKPWETFADPAWVHTRGNTVQWTGEIVNREDDMAGTSADKCSFTECQFRTHGNDYEDAALTQAEVRTDDDQEWGVTYISGTAFDIWDKKPLP